MNKRIYLDHAATTATRPEVIEAMLPYLGERYGNPSGLYSLGIESKKAIDNARLIIAEALGTEGENIYFTGGPKRLKKTPFFNHVLFSSLGIPSCLKLNICHNKKKRAE